MSEFISAIPAFPAQNLDDAVAFYRDKLGFSCVHQDAGIAVLLRDGVALHLWPSSDTTWKKRGTSPPVVSGAESFLAGTVSCRIQVRDIDALYSECQKAGIVHPNGHISDKPYGQREFAVLDLYGNLIGFFSFI